MGSLQSKIDSILLPSKRTDAGVSDLRQLVFLIHQNRQRVSDGRTLDLLYAFGLGIAKRKNHAMSSLDRADMACLLKNLGWRMFPKGVGGGPARWVPPKPSGRKTKKRTPHRYRGRARW